MNRSLFGLPLVLLAVMASALLGLSVIESPGVALPFSVELVLLLALTLWGLAREPDPEIRSVLPLVLVTATSLVCIVAIAANLVPTRSAMRVDPAVALRAD